MTGVEIKEDDDYDELPCDHVFLRNNILDWYKQTISFNREIELFNLVNLTHLKFSCFF